MSHKDRKGRPIPQVVLDAAQLVWPRVLWLTDRELKDTARAAEILEKAVCLVESIMHRKGPQERILNLESYLYWAAVRTLNRTVERENMIQFIDDLEPVVDPQTDSYRHRIGGAQKQLLIRQVMRYLDTRTRGMFLLRVKGYSWEQIGAFLGIKANNAAVTYNAGVEKARQRILRGRPDKSKPATGGAR